MAGVAFLLKRRGANVTGCDSHVSPRTRWLEDAGIPVAAGHDPAHLTGIDGVVVTPAVPQSEPELKAARAAGVRVRRRGEVLAELVNAADGIAVCGTHGKTTTAVFTAKLLHLLGDDPGWCIGGECGAWPVAAAGTGPLVVEADESDGTLALYHAKTLVVTCVDYDHPEHFKSLADYRACFAQAEAQAADVIHAWELDAGEWPELRRLVCGRHNVTNARAAIEVALRRGHARDAIAAVLPQALAELPDRRFQRIWPAVGTECDAVKIVTDYAHHPAELACAVGMAAELHPKRLRVLFQPHRYSRTKALKDEFPAAFAAADEVTLIPVYPAFERPIAGGDTADLYASFRRRQQYDGLWPQGLRLARSPEEAWRHVFLTMETGDLILLAGAGDIINLVPSIRADMAGHSPDLRRQGVDLAALSFYRTGGISVGGGRPMVVGMGSNTWFSDCATDCEIVHAPNGEPGGRTVPAGMPGARLLAGRPWLSFMAGIPGTVGGWTRMNAGAFGDSFGNHVESVTVESADGGRSEMPAAECGFAYRSSTIEGLIVAVTLKEEMSAAGTPGVDDFLARRRRFPPRTCGSVFKNPADGEPAGRLLEAVGAKEMRVGGAYVWQEHANVIVAGDGATSSDILALARLMAAAVRDRFGITLEPEVRGLEVS